MFGFNIEIYLIFTSPFDIGIKYIVLLSLIVLFFNSFVWVLTCVYTYGTYMFVNIDVYGMYVTPPSGIIPQP